MSTLTNPLNNVGGSVSTLRHLAAAVGRLSSLLRPLLARALTLRRGRPWLALVVVPLAMVAATVALQLWWDVPLAVLAWRWANVRRCPVALTRGSVATDYHFPLDKNSCR